MVDGRDPHSAFVDTAQYLKTTCEELERAAHGYWSLGLYMSGYALAGPIYV